MFAVYHGKPPFNHHLGEYILTFPKHRRSRSKQHFHFVENFELFMLELDGDTQNSSRSMKSLLPLKSFISNDKGGEKRSQGILHCPVPNGQNLLKSRGHILLKLFFIRFLGILQIPIDYSTPPSVLKWTNRWSSCLHQAQFFESCPDCRPFQLSSCQILLARHHCCC